jgi:hypothetical protein
MDLQHFLILLAGGGLVTLVTCACLRLLKFSQNRENAEDEILWEYLLRPEGRP